MSEQRGAAGNPTRDNIALLRMARDVLQSLDDQIYRDCSAEQGSVGSQFRHVLDFYECFLAAQGSGRVDYTARSRDVEVEQQRSRAIQQVGRVIESLEALDVTEPARGLRVRLEGSYDAPCDDYCASSLQRELQFLLSHSIHHFTIIRALLSQRGVRLAASLDDFGVAPSSVRHYLGAIS